MRGLRPAARRAFAARVISVPVAVTRQPTLTASALSVDGRVKIAPTYSSWQAELWELYDSIGEYRFIVDWKANLISRVRLRAARKEPGKDEPTVLDTGPAADIMNDLMSLTVDASENLMMADLATQLNVPGECWLLGETISGQRTWRVLSTEEIRDRGRSFEVIDEISTEQNIKWRKAAADSMLVRVWRPSKRLRYQADSQAKAARSTMRELELLSRSNQAQYLSRLATAGVFIMPDEVSFPVRPEFDDAVDPFTREWIEVAAEAIRTPGTAASVVPIPMRVPAEYVDKFKHIDFTLKHDEKIMEKLVALRERLATQLDAPPEILLGSGDVNHWSAWAIDENAVKAHILPTVEVIVNALTVGYLHPMLKAAGESTEDIVAWYDASEITIRPDRSDGAKDAYDRLELSGAALRRESGFDEDDAPTDEELKRLILKRLAVGTTTGFEALNEILGRAVPAPAAVPPAAPGAPAAPGQTPSDRSRPDTIDEAPAPTEADRAARLIRQARAEHFVDISSLGPWELMHPPLCRDHLFECPYTTAAYLEGLKFHPGTTGAYQIELDAQRGLRVGLRVLDTTREYIPYTRSDKSKLKVIATG